jgi:hypothetical protein
VSDEKLEASKPVGVQRLNAALTSPFGMNEIALRLNAIFGSDERRGAFIRSLVHIRANDITFNDKPDGSKEAIFDILAVGFGDNGIPVEQSGKTFTVTVTKAQYDRFIQKGFVYDFTFPIKKPGAYQLRIAIRDHASERVGSANQFIEVPNLKKDRLTLSGVVLENLTMDEIKNATASAVGSDALIDTSLRQFKSGTVLNYGFFIFNAKTDASRMPNLSSQIRLFRDGKPLFEGKPQPIAVNGSSDLKAIARNGSLVLGTSMMIPGAYVMEIAVTDNLAKTKNNTAIQYVQFEIVE